MKRIFELEQQRKKTTYERDAAIKQAIKDGRAPNRTKEDRTLQARINGLDQEIAKAYKDVQTEHTRICDMRDEHRSLTLRFNTKEDEKRK
jgi:hypothetical protein